MCNPNNLQQIIQQRTGDGKIIADFLFDTMQGKTPDVKTCHRMEAMKYIVRLGSADQPDKEDDKFWGLIPTPEELATARHSRAEPAPSEGRGGNPEGQGEDSINTPSPSTGEGRDGGENPPHPVTYLDILNYNLAQLIRSETAEGHTITEFLLETVTGRDSAFTPNKFKIKPDDRMTAAREVINRGFGRFGRRRKLIDDAEEANDYDTLHSDLAKRLRQYSEQGSQAILFLLDVMRNDFPDEQYTRRHRVSAAQELLRRGWDTNYDSIKQEHLLAYWRDQQDARLSVGQKKQLAGLHAYADEYQTYDTTDYNSIAKQLHEQQDREDNEDSAATKSLPPRRGKVRMGVTAPAQSKSNEDEATPTRHSRKEPAPSAGKNSTTLNRHSRAGGNPEGQGGDGINTPSPVEGEGRDGGEKSLSSPPSMSIPTQEDKDNYTKTDPDPEQDCYYEPLSPEDQAIFDYQTLIDSGEYKEGEIEIQPPSKAAHQEYAATLKWIRQAATAEGIPLLPNPLSGALKRPTARSP